MSEAQVTWATEHNIAEDSFMDDDDGFYTATCACGWTFGPVPGFTEVADVLMEHAYEMGYRRGATPDGG
jgi:hypothetical protein